MNYLGVDFNPRAHAETRLEIGGKKRNFVLKMRDGMIYFKEPSRAPIFAIPLLFTPELAGDSIGLISAWQREVAAGNYGAFLVKRDYFQALLVRGQFLMIVQQDGKGWMKEHFDDEWFLLPEFKKIIKFDVWNNKEVEIQTDRMLPRVKLSLLQRTISPQIRRVDAPRWIGGDAAQFQLLLAAGAKLFLSNMGSVQAVDCKIKSHSAFAKGEFQGYWIKNALRDSKFAAFWRTVEAQILFLGVKWSEGGEQNVVFPQPRSERFFNAGIEEWGSDWRGNWAPQRGSFSFDLGDFSSCSAHEKLEAALAARDFLRGQMSDAEINALLQNAV